MLAQHLSQSPRPLLVVIGADDSRPAHLALVGLRPMVVHSIDSAFKALAEREFSGIVVDLELPNQDMLSFVSAVRQHGKTSKLAILALGCHTETSEELALERGVDVVLRALCRVPSIFAEDVRAALRPVGPRARNMDVGGHVEPVIHPDGSAHFLAPRRTPEESGVFACAQLGEASVTRIARPGVMKRMGDEKRERRSPLGARLDPFSQSYAMSGLSI